MKYFFLTIFVFLSALSFAQNEDKSELAKVMVKMLQYIKTEKTFIQKEKKPQAFPKTFENIYSATPTQGKRLSDNHAQLSDNFIALLENYYNKKEISERKKAFNLVVQSCIACHVKVCPGPIAAIEKNLIE